MFDLIYNFYASWVFGEGTTLISASSQELVLVLLCVLTICLLFYIAILPIKAIIKAIFGGW